MKKNKTIIGFVVFLVLLAVNFVIAAFVQGDGDFVFSVDIFSGTAFIIGASIIGVIYLSIFIKSGVGKNTRESGEGTTKEGQKMSQYFDSRWISAAELRSEPRFRYNTWESLKNEKQDGIVIRSLLEGGKLNINFANSIHTMIIGTTGSGKTTLYIEPTIRIYSQMAAKPCMVITDPKGELYNNHSIQLKDAGYRVLVLDLRTPYASTRWNPLDNAYNNYHKAHNFDKLIKIHRNDKPSNYKLKMISNDYKDEWYELDGIAYGDRQTMEMDLNAKKQILIDNAENELREIAATVCTVESKHDPSWERGAQDFFYGLMLAMLEDSIDPTNTGMTREKFNFYNIAKMAYYKDPDPDNQFGTLREYASGRSKFSKVPALVNPVINNAPNTSRSYMGVLQGKISIFQDGGICYATSENEMYFDDFTDMPTVLFIKVPDEKESRHSIATMCVSQIYKKLIEKASESKNLKLPRPVHFLLDEFANLPKIEKMESLVTVGRSRSIYFHLVVQSYSQLDNKYGKEAADIIRGNCNIQIYIGTDDQKTKEDFSKLCGDVSIETKNRSQQQGQKKEDSSTTVSTQVVTRPLIYPYELGQLPPKTIIVKIFQENPIKTLFTSSYLTPQFDMRKAKDIYVPAKPLDEERIFFDMKERNRKVLKRRPSAFDDIDF